MRSHLARIRVSQKRLQPAAILAVVIVVILLLWCRVSRLHEGSGHTEAPGVPYGPLCDTPVELHVDLKPPLTKSRRAILTVVPRIDRITCLHLTSSILSGFSSVAIGYERNYSPHKKFDLAMEAADRLGLRDWDVVLLLDSDTAFTGEDVNAILDEFDERAPLHPDVINVRAIRDGKHWAPMTFYADSYCSAPGIVHPSECAAMYTHPNWALDNAIQRASPHQWIHRPLFLNSGVVLMRVWALREFQRGFHLHTQFVPSRIADECDQSVATGLYLDMISDETRLGLVSSQPSLTRHPAPRVNQFGLHYGLLGLNTDRGLAVALESLHYTGVMVTGEQHGVHITTSISSGPFERFRLLGMTGAIVNRSHLSPLFFTKPAPGSDGRASRTVTLTGSLVTRPAEAEDFSLGVPPRLRFPVLVHTPGNYKLPRLELVVPLSGWSLALRFAPGYRKDARALVEESVVKAVRNKDQDTLLAVGNVCRDHLEAVFQVAAEV